MGWGDGASPALPAHRRTALLVEEKGRSEGMTGIEPALSAWEAEVLPLNYIPEA